jgi:hypothetical protein
MHTAYSGFQWTKPALLFFVNLISATSISEAISFNSHRNVYFTISDEN